MGAWDNLSIREKADMMRAAIRNGITTLPEIMVSFRESGLTTFVSKYMSFRISIKQLTEISDSNNVPYNN